MVRKIQINISNKSFYSLIIFGVFILLGIGVYAYGTSDPVVFGHSAGEVEGGATPSGFCIFSRTQTDCPSGWTRDIEFDGRTISGAAIPGGTGGSDSHTHNSPSHTHSMSYSSFPSQRWAQDYQIGWRSNAITPYAGWITGGLDSETANRLNDLRNTLAAGAGATSSTSSWPPYMDVIVCCKD